MPGTPVVRHGVRDGRRRAPGHQLGLVGLGVGDHGLGVRDDGSLGGGLLDDLGGGVTPAPRRRPRSQPRPRPRPRRPRRSPRRPSRPPRCCSAPARSSRSTRPAARRRRPPRPQRPNGPSDAEPSATASAMTPRGHVTERIASSLPGSCSVRGSQFVSRIATIGMWSLRLVDREVFLVRVDDPHGGGNRHVADAAERAGRPSRDAGRGAPFFVSAEPATSSKSISSSSLRRWRLCTVGEVGEACRRAAWSSVGIPTRAACSATGSWACFLVRTKRMEPPCATVL